ncbi:MAG: excisionase family DNA-binding protein [Acidobacteriota bacterium]
MENGSKDVLQSAIDLLPRGDYVGVSDLAKAVGITPRRVTMLIASGEIQALRPGRSYRIPKAEAVRFIQAAAERGEAA